MSYYIQKPSIINSDVMVYYAGKNKWTDDPTQRALFATVESTNVIHEEKNGGWKDITIVAE